MSIPVLYLTFLLFIASLGIPHASGVAYAHSQNHKRFARKLLLTNENREVKQCEFVGNNNYFGMVALESSKNKGLDPIERTNLLLFTNKGKLLQKFELATKQSSFFERQDKNYEKIHYTVSQDRRLLAVCKNISEKRYMEIEIWNMQKNQRINIFRLDRNNCTNSPIFDQSITKIAYINQYGKLSIWNIADGIRVLIPEPIRSLSCLGLSQDFNLAYCYDQKSLIGAYSIDKSNKDFAIQHPESMYPNLLMGAILRSLHQLQLRIPDLFYSLGMDKPQYISMQAKLNELAYFYRIPNNRRTDNKQLYKAILNRSQLDGGDLIESYEYEEPYDIRLADIKYSSKHLLLVGEDQTIEKLDYKSFFAVNFNDNRKHRFGVECAHDWELIPGTEHIITCGFCENKNKIDIWDTMPKKS